jgi:hypothetical protein
VIGHHLTSISVPLTVILSDVRDRVMIVSQAKVFFSLVILSILAGKRLAVALCPSGWFPLQKSLSFSIILTIPYSKGYVKKILSYYPYFFSYSLAHSTPIIFRIPSFITIVASKARTSPAKPGTSSKVLIHSNQHFFKCHVLVLYVLSTILQAEYNTLSSDCQEKSFILSKYFSTLLRHALNSSKPFSVIREPLSMQFSLYMSRYSSSVIISHIPSISISCVYCSHTQGDS